MRIFFDSLFIIFILSVVFVVFGRSLSNDHSREERDLLLRILLLGMAVKMIVITIWFYKVGHSLNYHRIWGYQGGDAVVYDRIGWYLAQYFKHGKFIVPGVAEMFGRRYLGYYYTVGLIYTVFGHQQFMVSFINTLLSIITALMMYRIIHHIFSKKAALVTLVFVLFYPHFYSASYYILKDIPIMFIVTGALWGLTTRKKLSERMSIFFAFLLLLVFFRTPLALMLGVLGIAHLLIQEITVNKNVIKAAVLGLLAVTLYVGVITQIKIGDEPAYMRIYYGTGVKAYHTENPGLFEGVRAPGEALERVLKNPGVGLFYIAQNLFFVFWGPQYFYSRIEPTFYPFWQNLSGIFHIIIMPMFLYGLWYSIKSRKYNIFILISLIAAICLAVLFVGVIYRYRLPMIPVFLMFAAVGCIRFKDIKFLYIPYILLFNIFMAANATMRDSFIVAKPLFILTVVMVMTGLVWYRKSIL